MPEPSITHNQSPVTGSDLPATGLRTPAIDSEDDDEIGLLDLLIVLAKHKKLIVGLTFLSTLVAAGITSLLPDIYTATTKILPPQQAQATSTALLSQLTGMTSGMLGARNSNDVYIAMLNSRTVRDKLIERGLVNDRKRPSRESAGPPEIATIATGKDGLITVEVDGSDPKRAADLANAYVDELMKFTQVLAVTEASQRRLFFERQFAQAKDNLASAEVNVRQALERGGLVKVDDQGRAMIEATAKLRAEMTVKEVQIGAMRAFATDRNPELHRAQQELESLKRELAKIEGTGSARAAGNASGGSGIDNLSLLRNLKYYETIYELLAKQYEMAKIDEAKDTSIIQVMDKAIAPEDPSKPRRGRIVLLSGIAALFVGVLLAFVLEAIAKASSDPQQAERLQVIKRHLSWRRIA